MSTQKLSAILFVVIGAIALAYDGYSYTSGVHNADMGSLHMSLTTKEHVYIPILAGLAFIVVGGVLLVIRK